MQFTYHPMHVIDELYVVCTHTCYRFYGLEKISLVVEALSKLECMFLSLGCDSQNMFCAWKLDGKK